MNILLTIHHPLDPNTGAPGSVLNLGRAYQNLGHQVHYFSFDNLPQWLPELTKSVSFPEFLASYLSKSCNLQDIDVIDASSGDTWLWAKWFRRFQTRRPLLVCRSHGLEHRGHLERVQDASQNDRKLSWKYFIYHGGVRLWEVSDSMKSADLNFFLNQADREYAITEIGVNPQQAHVVHNGIPESFLDLPFEPTPNSDQASLKIVQIGSYVSRKGVQYSLPAVNFLLKKYPSLWFTMLGTGGDNSQISEIYSKFDQPVRDRVQIIPNYKHSDLPTLLRGHHIKLFPSLSEGVGKALLEAMTCGLVGITTPTGALEIVEKNKNALVIPFRDQFAIQDAIESLILDREKLDHLRKEAYQAAQNFSWMAVAKKRLSLYQSKLGLVT